MLKGCINGFKSLMQSIYFFKINEMYSTSLRYTK